MPGKSSLLSDWGGLSTTQVLLITELFTFQDDNPLVYTLDHLLISLHFRSTLLSEDLSHHHVIQRKLFWEVRVRKSGDECHLWRHLWRHLQKICEHYFPPLFFFSDSFHCIQNWVCFQLDGTQLVICGCELSRGRRELNYMWQTECDKWGLIITECALCRAQTGRCVA